MSAQITPIDLTGILERAGADADAPEGSQAWVLAQALAAVTEVIASDRAYDEAMRAAHSAPEFSIREQQQAMTRLVAARARRTKALLAVQAGVA